MIIVGVILVLCAVGIFGLASARRGRPGASGQRAQDAEAEAQRWVDRLSGSMVTLDGRSEVAARQALADAAERLTAASSQLTTASSVAQFQLVSRTAIEGMYYIRAARVALGLDPGPEIPDLGERGQYGCITQPGRISYDGHDYAASPSPGPATPYYYPGGVAGGRSVPAGWYNTPWWKSALVAGAAGVGGLMLIETLLGGGGGLGGLRGLGGFGGPRGPGGFRGGGGFGGGGFGGGVRGLVSRPDRLGCTVWTVSGRWPHCGSSATTPGSPSIPHPAPRTGCPVSRRRWPRGWPTVTSRSSRSS